MKKLFIVIFSMFLSTTAYAACGVNNGTDFCDSFIQVMRVFGNDQIFVRPSDDMGAGGLTCVPRINNKEALLRNTNPLRKEIYTLLLTAQLTNTKVQLNFETATDGQCDIASAILRVDPPPAS